MLWSDMFLCLTVPLKCLNEAFWPDTDLPVSLYMLPGSVQVNACTRGSLLSMTGAGMCHGEASWRGVRRGDSE